MKVPEALSRRFDVAVRVGTLIFCMFAVLFLVLPYRGRDATKENIYEVPISTITPPSEDTLDLLRYCCEKPYPQDWACCPYCGTHLRHNRFERHLLRLEDDPDYAKRWEAIEERLERERGEK